MFYSGARSEGVAEKGQAPHRLLAWGLAACQPICCPSSWSSALWPIEIFFACSLARAFRSPCRGRAVASMDDFQRINREMHITVLINIHHVELALQYATRVVGIRAGEIVYDGPADQVDQAVLDAIYQGKQEEPA